MNVYSELKAAWYANKIEKLRKGWIIAPSHVQLIISDLCNQNCHFCAYRMDGGFSTEQFAEGDVKNPNRRIPKDKVIDILNDCKELGVEAIQFTGGGEPTVHPDHIDIFEHAQFLGLKTGLVTNGVVMRDLEVLGRFDWIRISLDAGEAESYNKVRESDKFHKVVDNIKSLTAHSNKPVIGVGFVVTMENWEDVPRAAAVAKECGVSYIRLAAMFSEKGSSYYSKVSLPYIYRMIEIAKTLEDDNFEVVDLFSHRLDDLDQGNPDYSFCGYQNFTIYIGGDQKVYRCCTTSYTKYGEVGDLSDKSFKDWFLSEARERLYKEFDARNCHHCQFNAQNRVINYLMSKPKHVEFV